MEETRVEIKASEAIRLTRAQSALQMANMKFEEVLVEVAQAYAESPQIRLKDFDFSTGELVFVEVTDDQQGDDSQPD